MKYLLILIISFIISNANANQDIEFRPRNSRLQASDALFKKRYTNRKKRIIDSVEKIKEFIKDGKNKIIPSELSLLGDECLNLYKVVDLPKKQTKKVKKIGNSINIKCFKLIKKYNKKDLDYVLLNWEKIFSKINNMLTLCE